MESAPPAASLPLFPHSPLLRVWEGTGVGSQGRCAEMWDQTLVKVCSHPANIPVPKPEGHKQQTKANMIGQERDHRREDF